MDKLEIFAIGVRSKTSIHDKVKTSNLDLVAAPGAIAPRRLQVTFPWPEQHKQDGLKPAHHDKVPDCIAKVGKSHTKQCWVLWAKNKIS